MRRFLIYILSSLICVTAQGQRLDPNDYVYPILGVKGLYSANFGEIRPGHFHAGVDIKTEGVEGKELVAAADGYIARVTITAGGYGRAVYLVTNKGTTAVYGHLSRFRDDIEEHVRNERYARKNNSIECSFAPDTWPVKQGDCIGWSGNSGTSGGPHLHYELRETASGRYLNPVRKGIIRPTDNKPPRIVRIHYVEVDSVSGVCLRSAPKSYDTQEIAPGRYRLLRHENIEVGPKGYFIVQVTDRRNGVANTFGIWRLTALADGVPYFEYRMDSFLPEHSRECDAVSSYAIQKNSRNEVIRLAQLETSADELYTLMHERGIVRTSKAEVRRIRIEAQDDCGNCAQLEFDVRGGATTFSSSADTTAIALRPESAATIGLKDQITAAIPAQALYESIWCRPERLKTPPARSGLIVLSPAYRIFDASTPLRKEVDVAIRAAVPLGLQLRTTLAQSTAKGLVFAGGVYTNGVVCAKTRTTGPLVVVADTLAPQITPLFTAKGDFTRATSLRFRVEDNFSGIAAWALFIDEQWVPCDRFPTQNTIVHVFDKPARGQHHTIELRVRDACGNRRVWKAIFYR